MVRDPQGVPAPPTVSFGRPATRRDRWESRYATATIATDVVAITIMVLAGYQLGLGTSVPQFGNISPGVGILAGTLMLFALLVCRAWDPQVIGQGSEEFSRVIRAVVTSAVILAAPPARVVAWADRSVLPSAGSGGANRGAPVPS